MERTDADVLARVDALAADTGAHVTVTTGWLDGQRVTRRAVWLDDLLNALDAPAHE